MKKSILILMTAIIPSLADAQVADYRERFLFGLKAGFNYSNVYDEKGDNFVASPKIGFAGGAFAALPINRYIGVQPEMLISQKGFEAKGTILAGNYEFTRTSTFLDIPLMLAFKPSGFLTILAGPQYSYLISRKDVFANGSTSIEREKEFENEDLRKNILGFNMGADITLQHIVLSGRAGWDIQSNHKDGTSSTPRYKNMWYQATVGYRFYD